MSVWVGSCASPTSVAPGTQRSASHRRCAGACSGLASRPKLLPSNAMPSNRSSPRLASPSRPRIASTPRRSQTSIAPGEGPDPQPHSRGWRDTARGAPLRSRRPARDPARAQPIDQFARPGIRRTEVFGRVHPLDPPVIPLDRVSAQPARKHIDAGQHRTHHPPPRLNRSSWHAQRSQTPCRSAAVSSSVICYSCIEQGPALLVLLSGQSDQLRA